MNRGTVTRSIPGTIEALSLPAPFYVDQGAVRLDARGATADTHDVLLAARVVIAAADRALYIGPESAAYLASCAAAIDGLGAVQRGRMLVDLLMCERPAEAVELSVRLGIMVRLLPDLDRLRAMPKRPGLYKDVFAHTLRVIAATPADELTRLAALFHDIAKPDTLVIESGAAHFPNHDLLGADRAARRLTGLGFAPDTVEAVKILVRLHLRANSYEPGWTDSAVRRLHLDAGPYWEQLLALSYADVTSSRPESVARAHRRVQELAQHAASLDQPADPCPLDGNELMTRLNRGPGRWIGEVKHYLTAQVNAGAIDPTDKEAAWGAALAYLAQHKAG